jgi:hypothetical protein
MHESQLPLPVNKGQPALLQVRSALIFIWSFLQPNKDGNFAVTPTPREHGTWNADSGGGDMKARGTQQTNKIRR